MDLEYHPYTDSFVLIVSSSLRVVFLSMYAFSCFP